MAVLRHEYNLLFRTITASNITLPESTTIGDDQQNGPWTNNCYFEVIAKVATGSMVIALNNSVPTQLTTVTVSGTSYTRIRSASFGLPFDNVNMSISGTYTGGSILAARVIIIQDTGANVPTQMMTSYPIGSFFQTTSTVFVQPSNPKYWFYDPSKWTGVKTFFIELCVSTSGTGNFIVKLQVADGTGNGFQGWTDVPNTTFNSSSTAVTPATLRKRVINPADVIANRWYRIMVSSSVNTNTVTVYGAWIIVSPQEGIQKGFAGSFDAVIGGAGGGNEAVAMDFQLSQSALLTSVTLKLQKLGAPTDTFVVEIRTTRDGTVLGSGTLAASSVSGTAADFTIPLTTPAPVSGGVTYTIQMSRSPNTADASNNVQVGKDSPIAGWGPIYPFFAWIKSGSAWAQQTYNYYFILTGQGGVARYQDCYSLVPGGFAAGTALQGYNNLFDPAEYDHATPTLAHQVDAAAASTSAAKVQYNLATTPTDVPNSLVSSPDNAKIGVIGAMPIARGAAQEIDAIATINNGDLFGDILIASVEIDEDPGAFEKNFVSTLLRM